MIGQQESNRTLYHQKLGTNRKTCNHFLKSRCISELSWYFFEKYKCSGIAFFLQSSRYASTEQPCLKTNGLYDDPLLLYSQFHLFLFHIQYSHFIQFMFSNFSISFYVLSQDFIKHSRKAFVYICIIHMFQKTYEFLPN